MIEKRHILNSPKIEYKKNTESQCRSRSRENDLTWDIILIGFFFSLLSVVAVSYFFFGAKRGDTNKKSRLAASLTLDLTHVLCLLLIFFFFCSFLFFSPLRRFVALLASALSSVSSKKVRNVTL